MTDLTVEGMNVAPSVLETIITLAAREVEGVACIGSPAASGILSFLAAKPSTQGIEVDTDEEGKLHVSIRMDVKNGYVLPDVAANVRQAVADAVATQVGLPIGSVDIFIDGIQFNN